MQTSPENITPPSHPGEWSLVQIQEAFKRKLPSGMLKKLPSDKGNALYLPWYTVNKILDKYAPGWTWEIKETLISRVAKPCRPKGYRFAYRLIACLWSVV